MLRIPHCLDNRLTDGNEVVSLKHRPRFTPQKWYFSDTHFCWTLSKSQGLVRPEGLGKFQNFLTWGIEPVLRRANVPWKYRSALRAPSRSRGWGMSIRKRHTWKSVCRKQRDHQPNSWLICRKQEITNRSHDLVGHIVALEIRKQDLTNARCHFLSRVSQLRNKTEAVKLGISGEGA
jgi:hypothetical protein